MGQVPAIEMPDGLLELKHALEADWPEQIAALRASGIPLNEGNDPPADPPADPPKDPPADPKPPWGADDDFDPARAWKLIQDTRADREKLKSDNAALADRLKKLEDAQKTDDQRREEARAEAERRAAEAESVSLRLEVALDKAPEGMSTAQVRKLAKRLTGNTREELEQDAAELFSEFITEEPGGEGPPRRPQPRLRPGAAPSSEPDEDDPAKLAASVPRMYQ